MKKIIGFVILFILICSGYTISSDQNITKSGNILYVGGSGLGNYTTIQSALDDAESEDTVFVYNGIYYENLDIPIDDIQLLGENKYETIISGDTQTKNGITIKNHEQVHISNFTIRNIPTHPSESYWHSNGIHIWAQKSSGINGEASNNIIDNCIIYNCSNNAIRITAIDVGQTVAYNLVSNCEIFHNGFNDHYSRFGIYISADEDPGGSSIAHNNIVKKSNIYMNYFGGVYIGHEGETCENKIVYCQIYNNSGDGVFLYSGGPTAPFTHSNMILSSTICRNQGRGVNITDDGLGPCNNNSIVNCNFYNNTINTYDECTNNWYNETYHLGNYYDDYTGIDTNHDFIGDTYYSIPGGMNEDAYPLMQQGGNPSSVVWVNDDYHGYYDWDVNIDWIVDMDDFNLVIKAIGSTGPPGWIREDVNNNGMVSAADLSTMLPYYGFVYCPNYNSIQDGIDSVVEQGTVYVCNGVYYENIFIDKSIDLIGMDKNYTVIDGKKHDDVINLSSDGIVLKDFTIINSSKQWYKAGVTIHSNYDIVKNNNIADNENGISIYPNYSNNSIENNLVNQNSIGINLTGSYSTLVYDNNISNNSQGIFIWRAEKNIVNQNQIFASDWVNIHIYGNSQKNTIINNIISNSQEFGIRIRYSENNTIIDNKILGNVFGMNLSRSQNNNITSNIFNKSQNYDLGLVLSHGNDISDNIIKSNSWRGIDIAYSTNNNIISNNISKNNESGIYGCSLENNTIVQNNISQNNFGVHIYGTSKNNNFYHNNFYDNILNSDDESQNRWDDGYPIGGNYWDDYLGIDTDGDGIGNSPYAILGGDNEDRFPLMTPYGPPCAIIDYTTNGTTAFFESSYSYDYNGHIVGYYWDFGDGYYSTHANPIHTFLMEGIYKVILTVTDNDGISDTVTKQIIIESNVLGDMNGDGHFNSADVRYIALFICGNPAYIPLHVDGDVNSDGRINAADVRYIAMYLCGDPLYNPLYP